MAKRWLLAMAMVGLLVAPACDEAVPRDAEPEPVGSSVEGDGGCGTISQPVLQVLASRIVVGNATLNVNSIPASTSPGSWLVAGEIDGEGYEDIGDVAVWATTSDPESEDASLEFTAVNDLAIEGSRWSPDPTITDSDPAIATLEDCVLDF